MNLRFIQWLLPIILELFKGNSRYPGYFKRNKTIALLLIACLFCLGLALFMFEQAIMHGANSKAHFSSVSELSNRLESCKKDKEDLKLNCQSSD